MSCLIFAHACSESPCIQVYTGCVKIPLIGFEDLQWRPRRLSFVTYCSQLLHVKPRSKDTKMLNWLKNLRSFIIVFVLCKTSTGCFLISIQTLRASSGDQDGKVSHRNSYPETYRFPATNKMPGLITTQCVGPEVRKDGLKRLIIS